MFILRQIKFYAKPNDPSISVFRPSFLPISFNTRPVLLINRYFQKRKRFHVSCNMNNVLCFWIIESCHERLRLEYFLPIATLSGARWTCELITFVLSRSLFLLWRWYPADLASGFCNNDCEIVSSEMTGEIVPNRNRDHSEKHYNLTLKFDSIFWNVRFPWPLEYKPKNNEVHTSYYSVPRSNTLYYQETVGVPHSFSTIWSNVELNHKYRSLSIPTIHVPH